MKKILFPFVAVLTFMSVVSCSKKDGLEVFPSKPIKVIVPFGAGGGTDSVARALVNEVKKEIDSSIVVVNKTGGGGGVGMTEGANAANDGYTVTMITREIISLPILGLSSIDKDDFEIIRLVNMDPAMLVVKADSPIQNLDQFLSEAKTRKLKFASTANPNFYLLTMMKETGTEYNEIPFKGASEAIPAVLGGHTDFTIANPGELKSQLEAGNLRAIAVMAADRVKGFEDVPTFKESGHNVISGTWRGLAVPKGTDQKIVEKLSSIFDEGIKSEGFVKFMTNANLGIVNLGPQEFKDFMLTDHQTLESILK